MDASSPLTIVARPKRLSDEALDRADDVKPAAKVHSSTRNRRITSCLSCRTRKIKCDRGMPGCLQCKRDQRECSYIGDYDDINQFKETVGREHERLAHKIARKTVRAGEDFSDPEINLLTSDQLAYEDDDEDDDEIAALGLRLGRCIITDKIGGMFRPRMAEELTRVVDATADSPDLLAEANRLPRSAPPYVSPAAIGPNSFPETGPAYNAPQMSLLLNESSLTFPPNGFPTLDQAERVLDFYWTRVLPVAHTVHRPTFERQWVRFWHAYNNNMDCDKSLQALVYAVLFVGLVSMLPEEIDDVFGGENQFWLERFQMWTEAALSSAKVAGTKRFGTLQAITVYFIPLCRAHVSRAHTTLVATAIRSAQCMGLDNDPTAFGYNPVDAQVRRVVWRELLFLDVRTAEAQAPRAIVRPGDFDAKLPLNVNDADFVCENAPSRDSKNWTDMTLTIIRFRCNEFIREVAIYRQELREDNIKISTVIDRIEMFRTSLEDIYGPMIDHSIPIQRYGGLLIKIQMLRTYAMILHQYHMHPRWEMPARLQQVLHRKGLETMETVMQLETSPEFAPWRWYAGAIQQHHYALLMLLEMQVNPKRKDAKRIMRCLDYVFQPPPNLGPVHRVRHVVTEARDKMVQYIEKRRIRAPMTAKEAMPKPEEIPEPSWPGVPSRHTQNLQGNVVAGNAAPHGALQASGDATGSTNKFEPFEGQNENAMAFGTGIIDPSKVLTATEALHPPRTAQGMYSTSPPKPKPVSRSVPALRAATGRSDGKEVLEMDWETFDRWFPPTEYNGELDMSNQAYQESFYSAPGPSKYDDPHAKHHMPAEDSSTKAAYEQERNASGVSQSTHLQGYRSPLSMQPVETGSRAPRVDQVPTPYPTSVNNASNNPPSQWHDTVALQPPQMYPVNITNYCWNNMTAYGSNRTNVTPSIPGAFPTQPDSNMGYQSIPAAFPTVPDDNTSSFRGSIHGAFPDLPEEDLTYHEGFPAPVPPQPGDNSGLTFHPYEPPPR